MTAEPRKEYFPAIDGLRLLASINIVFLHLQSSYAFEYASSWGWIMPVVTAPAFAAGIFFVFAGFLFASKFSDPERRLPVIPFMFSRISRLYRCHVVCTLLMFIVLLFKLSGYHDMPSGLGDIWNRVVTGYGNMDHPIRSLFLHITLLWAFIPEMGMKLNEPSWSLSAFFLCYALTPWVARHLLLIKKPKTLWLLFFACFVPGLLWGIVFANTGNLGVLPVLGNFGDYDTRYRFFHMFPFVRMFEYFWGMVLFRLYREGQFDCIKKNYLNGFIQAGLLLLLYVSVFSLHSRSVYWNFVCHHSVAVLIYGLLVVSLATTKGWLSWIFCIKPIRAVGKASFYPYLLHLPFISIFWAFTDMNNWKATVVFLVFLYTVSTLYQKHKDKIRAKAKAAKAALKAKAAADAAAKTAG